MKNQSFSAIVNTDQPGILQILLEGQLVIKNAAAIKRMLLTTLGNAQNISLAFGNIVKLDLAVLQLLMAFQKSASAKDIKISFDIASNHYVTSVINRSGLEHKLCSGF